MSQISKSSYVYSLNDFKSSGIVSEINGHTITYTCNNTGENVIVDCNSVTLDPTIIIQQLLIENQELRDNYFNVNQEIIRLRTNNYKKRKMGIHFSIFLFLRILYALIGYSK